MKKIKFHILPILAAMTLAGCTEKDPDDNGGGGAAEDFRITADKTGALSLDAWKAGDQIKIVCADELYTFEAASGGASAEFADVDKLLTADKVKGKPVSAYYNCTTMYGTFRVQTEQSVAGGVNSYKVPMFAYSMNEPVNNKLSLTFKPLVSILELTVAPRNISVGKLTIAPADDASISNGAMAGEYTVDAAQNTVKTTNGINSITLLFENELDLTAGVTLSLPIGWFSVDGGLKLTFDYGSSQYSDVLWADAGMVKTYTDNGGFREARLIKETFAFDENAFPRDFYVKTTAAAGSKGVSWDSPATLSYALRNAMSGSTIHIAAGTYYPEDALSGAEAGDAAKTFEISRNVTLIGGYPANAASGAQANPTANATILDGGGKSCHTVVVGAPKFAAEKVVINGVTITGGKGDAGNAASVTVNETALQNNYGAGIAIVGTNAELINCNIQGNNGHSAVGLYVAESNLTITGGRIADNAAAGNGAGAWITTGAILNMTGTTIDNNSTSGSAIAAGLYLYAPAGESLTANLTDCKITGNKSAANAGGMYIRDDSGNNLLNSSFTNCEISGNTGAMGAAFVALNAKAVFTGCAISGNTASGNGVVYINTASGGNSHIVFDKCTVGGNETTGSAVASGLYIYNNGGKIDAFAINSTFSGNTTAGRGGAIYARNNQAGDVNVTCVNSSFSGNRSGSYGGAIAMYGAVGKNVNVSLISCTMADNNDTHATALGGGVGMETAGLTLTTYNTIVSGNTANGAASDVFVNASITATVSHRNTIVGGNFFNASGAESATSPAFAASTMIGPLADNGGATLTRKLIGTSSTNFAIGNGMTATALKALATAEVAADVLGADQTGAARSDSSPVMGACVK